MRGDLQQQELKERPVGLRRDHYCTGNELSTRPAVVRRYVSSPTWLGGVPEYLPLEIKNSMYQGDIPVESTVFQSALKLAEDRLKLVGPGQTMFDANYISNNGILATMTCKRTFSEPTRLEALTLTGYSNKKIQKLARELGLEQSRAIRDTLVGEGSGFEPVGAGVEIRC